MNWKNKLRSNVNMSEVKLPQTPRELSVINQELNDMCYKLGVADFNEEMAKSEKYQLRQSILNLRKEGLARQELDKKEAKPTEAEVVH